jgi:hypothetical protein
MLQPLNSNSKAISAIRASDLRKECGMMTGVHSNEAKGNFTAIAPVFFNVTIHSEPLGNAD